MKYRRIAKKIKKLGCHEVIENNKRKRGSHRIWCNPSNGNIAAIPDHRSKDLQTPTLRSILKQLEIDQKDFDKA
jgi:predicted RNA binding protein YcfA (HicA-like mRNA interferase family)